MPASILWFSSTTDVIFQVLPAFWKHFAFFWECWFLVRFHRSIEIWPQLSLIRRFYFHHGFGMFWLGIFRGMRSSNVDLECRHWFCDLGDKWMPFLGFLPKFLTVYKHFWAHRHIFQCIFQSFYIYRRKFRSQTSDNMDRWKAEQGRGREKRKIRREKIRRERVRRQKI